LRAILHVGAKSFAGLEFERGDDIWNAVQKSAAMAMRRMRDSRSIEPRLELDRRASPDHGILMRM
jgi:hypothetical protein